MCSPEPTVWKESSDALFEEALCTREARDQVIRSVKRLYLSALDIMVFKKIQGSIIKIGAQLTSDDL